MMALYDTCTVRSKLNKTLLDAMLKFLVVQVRQVDINWDLVLYIFLEHNS